MTIHKISIIVAAASMLFAAPAFAQSAGTSATGTSNGKEGTPGQASASSPNGGMMKKSNDGAMMKSGDQGQMKSGDAMKAAGGNATEGGTRGAGQAGGGQ